MGKIIALRDVRMGLGFVVLSAAMAIAAFAAWITHVMWAIGKLASDAGITLGQVILAALGIFVPPIGVLHGLMIWFGVGL